MESPVISCFLPFDSVEQVSSTVASLYSTETIRQIAENIPEDGYTILCSGYSPVCFGSCAIDRFIRIAEDTVSGICYADYYINISC